MLCLTRILSLLFLGLFLGTLLGTIGCNRRDEGKPNPELQVPEIPPSERGKKPLKMD